MPNSIWLSVRLANSYPCPEEKDLGIVLSSNLTWNAHVNGIISKSNKLLGLLKRTCPLLTDTRVRRSLYLSLVKSHLAYGSEIWSPNNNYLKAILGCVQRRATRWILASKTWWNILPLTYDREIKDLVFFFKSVNGCTFINLNEHISFVKHGRTRLSSSSTDLLQVPLCSTATFQASFFNRIVKLWNLIVIDTPPTNFISPLSFKRFLQSKYIKLLISTFDVDCIFFWTLSPDCFSHCYK